MEPEEREALDDRCSVQCLQSSTSSSDLARAVREGLRATPKRIPCRFFYDETGSELFERICELPEYYLTRAEDEILARHAREIAAAVDERCALVELGSGSARKTRHLLDALAARPGALTYVPIDIAVATLESSSRELIREYPSLRVRAIAGEYEEGLALLRAALPGPKLIAWLGSNVGNFSREAAALFLSGIARGMGAADRLLLGVDLRKDARELERAYDDRQGITARFNLNVLARINAELGADFDLTRFRHRASYDEREGRVQMHLESLGAQRVRVADLELDVAFEKGERMHTEDSYKYSDAEVTALARYAGLAVSKRWTDSAGRFAVCLMTRMREGGAPGAARARSGSFA